MNSIKMEVHFRSYLSGLLAIIVVFLLVFRFYIKSIAPYTVFPTSWVLVKTLQHIVTGKVPKASARSYVFQLIINDCKKFMSDGICVLWMPKPHIIVFNEEAIKILSNEEAALNKGEKYVVVEDILRSSLGVSDKDLWRKRRKMIQPAFHVSVLKNYAPIFNKHSVVLTQRLMMAANEPVDILHYLKKCTLDSLLVTVFGMESDDTTVDKEKFIEIIHKCSGVLAERMINPLLHSKFLLRFFSVGRQYMKNINEGNTMMGKMVLKMRENELKRKTKKLISEDDECSRPVYKSFAELAVTCHLQDPSFTMDAMADETKGIMIGGFDTVSNTVMWCLFLLGNHPEIQEQVYDEVKPLTGKTISYRDTQYLTYTDCVLKETLRLYPALPFYIRRLEKDIQCGKYNMPKEANVIFFPYLLHRNPKVYPNPEKFDPERFRGNTSKNSWSYVPFSEGIRNCIGKKYAIIQAKIILAHILQNFKVTSLKRVEDVPTDWEIILAASEPIQLRLDPRRSIS